MGPYPEKSFSDTKKYLIIVYQGHDELLQMPLAFLQADGEFAGSHFYVQLNLQSL